MLELTSEQVESIVKEDLHKAADTLESLARTLINEDLFKDYCTVIAALDYYGEQRTPSKDFTQFSINKG